MNAVMFGINFAHLFLRVRMISISKCLYSCSLRARSAWGSKTLVVHIALFVRVSAIRGIADLTRGPCKRRLD
jgi:hypothetical protein